MTPSPHVSNEMMTRFRSVFPVLSDDNLRDALTAALSAMPGQVAGWRLVPIEPDDDMMIAWDDCEKLKGELPSQHIKRIWAAMLAASPTPPTTAQEG